MIIDLGYKMSSYFYLPIFSKSYRAELSPYDLESVFLSGIALHPRITPSGISEGIWKDEVKDCGKPVFLSSNAYLCDPIAGLSGYEEGIAVGKGKRGYYVAVGKSYRIDGRKVVFSSANGALIASIYDPPYAHVVLGTPEGASIFERAYRSEPKSASLGYKSASIIYEDNRSQVFAGGDVFDAGLPLEAIAFDGEKVLAKSSGWLLWLEKEMPDPVSLIEGSGEEFIGFIMGIPIFRMENRLFMLEGGALIELEGIDANGRATASDSIAIDYGDRIEFFDRDLKKAFEAKKREDALCFAYDGKTFCCSVGICGFVEGKEGILQAESLSREHHTLSISSESIPVIAKHNEDLFRVEKGERAEIEERGASVLFPYEFEIDVLHALGTHKLRVPSPPFAIEIEANASAFISSGIHECGGRAYALIEVKRIRAPKSAEIYALGNKLEEGKSVELCLDEVGEIDIEAVDLSSEARRVVSKLYPIITEIPSPSSEIKISHKEDSSFIEISSDSEIKKATLHCLNEEMELKGGSIEVKECLLPAYITYELRKNGFIFERRRDIEIEGLEKFASVSVLSEEAKEFKKGGFKAMLPSLPIPEVKPLFGFEVFLGKEAEISFKSNSFGRLAVASEKKGFVKAFEIRTGISRIPVPFSEEYYLAFYNGRSSYSYKLTIPISQLLLLGQRQGLLLEGLLSK